MKKILFTLMMLLVMGGMNAETIVKVTGNNVRLRTSPYITNNNIYCQVSAGTTLKYYDTVGDWYQVGYKGQVLYVSRDFAGKHEVGGSNSSSIAPAQVSYRYVVVDPNVKHLLLRTGPSTNYDYFIWKETGSTVHLATGTRLEYLGEHVNGFFKVRYRGYTCWVSSKYSHLAQ